MNLAIRKVKTFTAPTATMMMTEMMIVIAKLAGVLPAIAISRMMMGAMVMITLSMMPVVMMLTKLAVKTTGLLMLREVLTITRCLSAGPMTMAMVQKDHDNATGWRATQRDSAPCGPKRHLAERFAMTRGNEGNGDDSNGNAGGGKKEDAGAGGDGAYEESRVARIVTSAMVTTMTMKTMLMMLMMMMRMMTIMSFMALAIIAKVAMMITAKMPALMLKKMIDTAIVRIKAMTVGAMTTGMMNMMMMVVTVVMI